MWHDIAIFNRKTASGRLWSRHAMHSHGDAYEGELASSILLDQNTAPARADLPGLPHPLFDSTLGPPNFFLDESRGRPAHQRMDIARTPSPSPVYQYGGPRPQGFGSEDPIPATSSSSSRGGAGFAGYSGSQAVWGGNQSGFVNMVLRNESSSPGLTPVKPEPKPPMSPAGPVPVDPGVLSMMMALQNQPPGAAATGPSNFPSMPPPRFVRAPEPEFASQRELSPSQALPPGPQPPRSQNENKKGKQRKDFEFFLLQSLLCLSLVYNICRLSLFPHAKLIDIIGLEEGRLWLILQMVDACWGYADLLNCTFTFTIQQI